MTDWTCPICFDKKTVMMIDKFAGLLKVEQPCPMCALRDERDYLLAQVVSDEPLDRRNKRLRKGAANLKRERDKARADAAQWKLDYDASQAALTEQMQARREAMEENARLREALNTIEMLIKDFAFSIPRVGISSIPGHFHLTRYGTQMVHDVAARALEES